MPILDSDILIGYLRNKPNCLKIINDLRSDEISIKTTVFNVAELYQGAYLSSKCEENKIKIKKFLNTLTVLEFNQKDAEVYSKISIELRKKGESIGDFDELIGSMAITRAETLITRNIRHYEKIPDIILKNWEEL